MYRFLIKLVSQLLKHVSFFEKLRAKLLIIFDIHNIQTRV